MSIKRLSTFPRFWRFSAGVCRALPVTDVLFHPSQVSPSTWGMQNLSPHPAQTQPEPPRAGLNSLRGCSDKLITISSSRGLQGTRGASPPQQALLLAEVTRAAFPSGEMPEVTPGTEPEQCLPAQPSKPIKKGSRSSKQLQALAQQLRGEGSSSLFLMVRSCSSRRAPSHPSDPLPG